ncbi:MAG: NifU N-terminal domain-containing protein [Planctomycetota bacterium]
MPYRVTAFDSTPNPNAIKCLVEPSPGPIPRSYFRQEQVDPAEDPLAAQIFQIEGVSSILIHTAFISVNKSPDASWGPIKKAVKAALADHP